MIIIALIFSKYAIFYHIIELMNVEAKTRLQRSSKNTNPIQQSNSSLKPHPITISTYKIAWNNHMYIELANAVLRYPPSSQ